MVCANCTDFLSVVQQVITVLYLISINLNIEAINPVLARQITPQAFAPNYQQIRLISIEDRE